MQDESFERILNARPVPEMRSHLPERIISASLKLERVRPSVALSWIADFWDCFVLPRPVLAMAVALLIGVVIGFAPDSKPKTDHDFFTAAQIQADLGDMV